jgi:hypothetical protein
MIRTSSRRPVLAAGPSTTLFWPPTNEYSFRLRLLSLQRQRGLSESVATERRLSATLSATLPHLELLD